jgi:hypothetical protein
MKDPVRHSEMQVRGELKPHDPVAAAETHTKREIERRQKLAPAPAAQPEQEQPEPQQPEPQQPEPQQPEQENPDAA